MKRVLTGLVLIPIFTYSAVWAPVWLFLLVLSVVALLCFWEFCGIVAAHGIDRPGPPAFAAGLVLMVAPAELVIPTLLTLVLLALSLRSRTLPEMLPSAGAAVLGLLYVFGSWRMAYNLRLLSPWWLFFALTINWVGDTAAYYTGRAFGRHRLAPVISPGKTVEGSCGSLIASVAFGVAYLHFLIPHVELWNAVMLATAGNIAGQLGDLVESAMKRGADLKDSGNLLPGHGGWLDRVDSSLFAVPVVYFLLTQMLAR